MHTNNKKRKKNYALSDKRCSQQLHAIANPSMDEVALPSSSITIRLLHPSKYLYKKINLLLVSRVKQIKRCSITFARHSA